MSARPIVLAVVGLTMTAAGPSAAQQAQTKASPGKPAVAATPDQAATPAPATAPTQPAAAEPADAASASEEAEPTAEQKTAAREHFKAGNDLYDAQKYEEALTAFRDSYRAVPSPNSRLMVGRTLTKMGRLAQAYEELQATEAEAAERGGKYEEAGAAARHDLEQLRPQIALLTVTLVDAPPDTLLTIRERDFPAESIRGPIPVMPGQVTVVAMAGGRTVSAVTQVAAGGEGAVQVVMTPAPEPAAAPVAAPAPQPSPPEDDGPDDASLRTAAYVAGGIGAAGFITFGVFGALNQSKFGDLQDSCPGSVCPANLQSDIDAGRMYQTIANVGVVVGIVGVATGATLFVLSSGGGDEAATAPRVEVAGGLGSVQVKGAF